MEQALIPLSILAPEGKHRGYDTWQLVTLEEGFQAAQNVYCMVALLPSDERSATPVYLVCHPLQLCTGILRLLLLRRFDMSPSVAFSCRKIPACVVRTNVV